MQEEIVFNYEGLGLRLPFKTYTFELGPYLISRRNMVLFKNYGIEIAGDRNFKFNQYAGVGDNEVIMDLIRHFWGQGSGGFHLSLKLPIGNYSSTCIEIRIPNKAVQIQYTSRINNTLIGEFTLGDDSFEWVQGHFKRTQEEHAWFLGISLLKLNEIRDSEQTWGH
jgi:hypothetical protein